ncbi:hypothetical protein [Pseudooceanicola sp. LIPI14-2-Ac024]|uniref:hypothetical protein n=1 Tax=Pseudooceanicola sp. LIPI14-2-Ac024 TaxID=3344875 RepID=UPI0035D0B2B7
MLSHELRNTLREDTQFFHGNPHRRIRVRATTEEELSVTNSYFMDSDERTAARRFETVYDAGLTPLAFVLCNELNVLTRMFHYVDPWKLDDMSAAETDCEVLYLLSDEPAVKKRISGLRLPRRYATVAA